jgi:hypothetical protein
MQASEDDGSKRGVKEKIDPSRAAEDDPRWLVTKTANQLCGRLEASECSGGPIE